MPATNLHSSEQGVDSPASNATPITPHASNELAYVTRGVYVGGAGNLIVAMAGGGTDVTFSNVAAGAVLPIRVKAVRSSSTATDLVALY